jgi:hypothetical protein
MSGKPEEPPMSRAVHVFVVLRLDAFLRGVSEPVDTVTATKAFFSQELAEEEAQRLNHLRPDDHSRYFVRLARLQASPRDIRAR